jgi:steroid 5-alpha reductase family enzyme
MLIFVLVFIWATRMTLYLGYSWLVINVTGQRTLEKKMAREKPQYAEYVRVTSGLIPRPPRRSNGV